MASVFVSHSSEDNYFVDFLAELLRFHHIDVWVDRASLRAGDVFAGDIEQALASCGSMVVVISRNALNSQWIVREIAAFRAAGGDRPVIPLMLDPDTDPDQVYAGLGQVTPLRCYESLLDSLSQLMRLLGRTLFPAVERRAPGDRRSGADRRQAPGDRRTGPVSRRLRAAMYRCVRETGRDLLVPLNGAREVADLSARLAAADSPLRSFEFVDRQSGEQADPGFGLLHGLAFRSWCSKMERRLAAPPAALDDWGLGIPPPLPPGQPDLTGAAYIIDDLVQHLMDAYVITPRDRRRGARRSAARRQGENHRDGREGGSGEGRHAG